MRDLLDADLIHRSIGDAARQQLERLDVLASVPSTNTWLSRQCARLPGRFEAVLAEDQTAGRGRHDKRWHSPPQSGLCLSLAYTFERTPPNLSCVTLATGAAIAAALEQLGVRDHGLKWPNDIVSTRGKLGGILTDALTGSGHGITIVTGVGLNVDLGGDELPAGALSYPIDDLKRCMHEPLPRSRIAASIIEAMVLAITQFERDGLAPYRAQWNTYDLLKGRNVQVDMPEAAVRGVADGIDSNGALRVLTERGLRRIYTGSVRVLDSAAKSA